MTEIESYIKYAVKEALPDTPESHGDHLNLVAKLVQALEGDASWVELYDIAGELAVPTIPEVDTALREPLSRAMEVRLRWYIR